MSWTPHSLVNCLQLLSDKSLVNHFISSNILISWTWWESSWESPGKSWNLGPGSSVCVSSDELPVKLTHLFRAAFCGTPCGSQSENHHNSLTRLPFALPATLKSRVNPKLCKQSDIVVVDRRKKIEYWHVFECYETIEPTWNDLVLEFVKTPEYKGTYR